MRENITGLRSGHLTAIEPTDQKRRGCTLWRCQCDCGKESFQEAYKIVNGKVKSCGCSRKGHGMKELTDQRFGRLVAVERLSRKKGSNYLWLCRCDCGREIETSTNALLNGNIKSCGCGKSLALKARVRDISGQRFGRLLALFPIDERMQGSVMWKCLCDCGLETVVSYNSLVSGNTTSCGCKKLEHEPPRLHYIDGTCIEMIDHPKLRRNNTSGYTGVQRTRSGKWAASITFKQKHYYLGTYEDIRDAVRARAKGEEMMEDFLNWYYETFPDVPRREE